MPVPGAVPSAAQMTRMWLKLLVLALILLAVAVIVLGPHTKPSTAVPNPTETGMDYPY
jgi:hypothetical protein